MRNMDMKVKLGCFLVSMILLLSMVSCNSTAHMFPQIKEDFEQFQSQNNVILYDSDGMVYTNEKEYRLPRMDDSSYIVDLEIINERIYFLTRSYKSESRGLDIALYECDLQGENPSLVWKKTSVANNVKGLFIKNILHVMYTVNDTVTVEEIDVLTSTSSIVFEGEDFDFSTVTESKQAQTVYSVQKEDGAFIITDHKSGGVHTVNQETLENHGYLDVLMQYNGTAFQSWVEDNRIYLIYRLRIEGFFEIPEGYPLAIFEYDYVLV